MSNTLLTSITVISKTNAEWIAQNPILTLTQAAYSTDTKELRIGNGILPWASLPVDSTHGSVPSHNFIHRFDGRDPITPADIKAAPVDINNKVPVVNLPEATTAAKGITQLNNTLTSTSTIQALTANQGKVLKDLVDTKETSANKNAANGYAGLDSNGKIVESLLPSITLMDTFEASSEAGMLALTTARKGDICIRTDLNRTFILALDGYSTLANWKELKTPTDAVLSVAGKTGTVTLVKADVGLSNVDNTSDANKPVSTATQTALNLKVDKTTTVNGKVLSANVTLTTSDVADSTDKRYVTDAQRTVLGNTSGVNTGNETVSSIGNLISSATAKSTPVAADQIALSDSQNSNNLKRMPWSTLLSLVHAHVVSALTPAELNVYKKKYTTTVAADANVVVSLNDFSGEFEYLFVDIKFRDTNSKLYNAMSVVYYEIDPVAKTITVYNNYTDALTLFISISN